jgi:hypothetical protein
MTDADLSQRLDDLDQRIEQIASVSEDVLVSQTGWLIAQQVLLAILLERVLRLSDDSETALNQITFDARSMIRNRTKFPDNSQESADRYRQSATEKIEQLLRDFGGTP